MAKPIVTFALADDHRSVFVYRGDVETGQLQAAIGLQREDADYQLREWFDAHMRDMWDDLEQEASA